MHIFVSIYLILSVSIYNNIHQSSIFYVLFRYLFFFCMPFVSIYSSIRFCLYIWMTYPTMLLSLYNTCISIMYQFNYLPIHEYIQTTMAIYQLVYVFVSLGYFHINAIHKSTDVYGDVNLQHREVEFIVCSIGKPLCCESAVLSINSKVTVSSASARKISV